MARVKYTGRHEGVVIADAMEMEDNEVEEDEAGDGEMWDLLRPLEGDCELKFFTFEDNEVPPAAACFIPCL